MGCISTKQTVNSVRRVAPNEKPNAPQLDSSTQDTTQKLQPGEKDLSSTQKVEPSIDMKNQSLIETHNPKSPDQTSIAPSPALTKAKEEHVSPQEQKSVEVKPIEKKEPEIKEKKVEKEETKVKVEKVEKIQKKQEEVKIKKELNNKKKDEDKEVAAVEKEIYTNFRKLGFAKYDEIFSKASLLLATAEKVRSGIEDSKQKSISLSNTFLLKEYSLLETVRVLLWAVSANYKGKIADTGIQVHSEVPYMNLPQLKKMMDEAQELYGAFAKYLKSVTEGTDVIKSVEETLSQLSEQAKALVQQGHKEIAESNLKEEEKQRIINRLDRYAEKYLPNELQKTKKLIPLIQKEMGEMDSIVPKLKELFDTADEVGAKVYLEYATELKNATDPEQEEDIQFMLAPARIFNVYSTQEAKSPREVEAYTAALKLAEESALKGKIARESEDKD